MRLSLMRTLALALLVSSALVAPAAAQIDPNRGVDLQALQQMDRQRSIALENQVNALEARVQSEQRLRDFQATLPPPYVYRPGEVSRSAPPAGYASIPDAALAASNARVKQALQTRR